MAPYADVVSAKALGEHRVELHFADGTAGVVDLAYLLDRGPVFEPLRDPTYFAQLRVDEEGGTIVWPNGADVAPETLYEAAQRHRLSA